jgi:hypothetical protein
MRCVMEIAMSAAAKTSDYWNLPMSERARLRNAGLTAEEIEARERAWAAENADAIKAYNDHVEKFGLTLPEFRPVVEAVPDDWNGEI